MFYQVGHIPEYHLTAIQLVHKDTGAKYLHVDRNDPNNVFSVNLRTTPMDSTGLYNLWIKYVLYHFNQNILYFLFLSILI